MKVLRQFACAFLMLVSLSAHARQQGAADPQVDVLLKAYLASWTTTDKTERIAQLQKLWAPEAVHENPFVGSPGTELEFAL